MPRQGTSSEHTKCMFLLRNKKTINTFRLKKALYLEVQYNFNGLNTDGSFTVDDSNSFFSPYKILPIAQENKYLGIFSYLIMELYVVCTH